MQCSNARFLSSDLRSSQRSKPQQLRIIAQPTSDQLKAKLALIFSLQLGKEPVKAVQSSLSNFDASSGNFAQAAARRKNWRSLFQIQFKYNTISHFHPQALGSLSRNFHCKSARFHVPKGGRIPLD